MIEATIAIPAMSSNSRTERSARAASTPLLTPFAPSLHHQIRGRDQHGELLAPDDHALIVLQIDARRNGVTLAALERAQPAKIDEHRIAEIGIFADAGLRHEIDVERRAGPDLEVAFEEHRALV